MKSLQEYLSEVESKLDEAVGHVPAGPETLDRHYRRPAKKSTEAVKKVEQAISSDRHNDDHKKGR